MMSTTAQQMAHTPEPWRRLEDGIVQTSHITRDVWHIPRTEADLDRIVACVNACAGLADPAAELDRLRAVNAELVEALKAMLDMDNPPAGEPEHIDFNTAVGMARAALARATE